MASWADIVADTPDLARVVRELFDSGTNKTLATVRRDGSPRISGTELEIDDERVSLGMMPHSLKLADVLRDPRVAIHSPTPGLFPTPADWPGDAKLAGILKPIEPGEIPGSYFALDIDEVVFTHMNEAGDKLVVESWHPGRGYRRIERE